MTAGRDRVWDEWAGTLAAIRDIEGELNDPDNPPGVDRRDKLRAAHREFTWRHLKVSVGLDTKTRTKYAAAFSGAPPTEESR